MTAVIEVDAVVIPAQVAEIIALGAMAAACTQVPTKPLSQERACARPRLRQRAETDFLAKQQNGFRLAPE